MTGEPCPFGRDRQSGARDCVRTIRCFRDAVGLPGRVFLEQFAWECVSPPLFDPVGRPAAFVDEGGVDVDVASRIGGWAAIAFAALLLGTNLVLAPAGLPLIGAPTGEVADFFGDRSGMVRLTSATGPFVWLLATVIGAAATAALWPVERRRGEAWSLAHAVLGFAAAGLQFASAVLLPAVFDDPGLLGLAGWLLWVGWIAWYGLVLIRTRSSAADRVGTPERAAP
ncbi:hypothetical protein AB0L25_15835 [Spirillospora sp. NPDC052242]